MHIQCKVCETVAVLCSTAALMCGMSCNRLSGFADWNILLPRLLAHVEEHALRAGDSAGQETCNWVPDADADADAALCPCQWF